MKKSFSSIRSTGIFLLIAAALGLRLYSVLTDNAGALRYVFYALVAAAVLIIAFECFRKREYARVFIFENRFHLDVLAYAAALGFFADFISHCHILYQSAESGKFRIFAYFAPQCIVAAGALLSCFYCCSAALSFASRRYDFRSMKLIHLAPLVWAIGHMLTVIESADSLFANPNGAIKYAALTLALGFSFSLAYEVESKRGARRFTVFCLRSFSLLCEVFFFDTLMLLLAGRVQPNAPDTVLSFSLALIGLLAFFLEKNIDSNTALENN